MKGFSIPSRYCGLLVVDPRYQGRGIGQALLQWAVDQADNAQPPVDMWLESSDVGLRVYEKKGFQVVDVVEMWTSTGELTKRDCMRRPAKRS
jgi:GNAT superfamily N-acetyltransferase